jgi:DUF1365 family protein
VVTHHRYAGPSHRFVYPVFMTLVDLAELPTLAADLSLFRWNRFGLLSLYDRDYLEASDTPVLEKLRRFTEAEGLSWPGGRVMLLTNCRVLGYTFNPASFFYLFDPREHLVAVVADVSNTFGERHPYLLHAANETTGTRRCPGESGGAPGPARGAAPAPPPVGEVRTWQAKKVFHVSPFFPLDGTYRFEFAPPGETCRVRIDLSVDGAPRLEAGLSLRRRALDDRQLLRVLARYPLNTAAVVGRIHWEALRLWWKGAPFHTKPPYDPEAARRGVA